MLISCEGERGCAGKLLLLRWTVSADDHTLTLTKQASDHTPVVTVYLEESNSLKSTV